MRGLIASTFHRALSWMLCDWALRRCFDLE